MSACTSVLSVSISLGYGETKAYANIQYGVYTTQSTLFRFCCLLVFLLFLLNIYVSYYDF